MIILYVVSRNTEPLERTADILLSEDLAVDVTLDVRQRMRKGEGSSIEKSKVYVLTAKSKSLLFDRIRRRLREEFGDELPEVYSVPIVNMDWEQTNELLRDVQDI